jgi:ADP-ribose pyrophosphatase
LKEETGYQATQLEPLGHFYASPGFSTEKMYLFFARQLSQAGATPEEDEEITVEWVPLAQAMDMIESGEIVDAKTIIGIYRAFKRLNQ